jgi:hypothetical protein
MAGARNGGMRGGRSRGVKVRLALVVPVSVTLALCGAPSPGVAWAAGAAESAPGQDIPDVAIVVQGGMGRTTSLRSGQPYFARLWQLLQPTYTGTERVSEEWEEGRHPPVRVTVVWALTGIGGWPQTNRAPGGDVAIQRQDQLVMAGDGTPWVRSDLAPDVEDDDIRWHRAPRLVYAQLNRAGLLGGGVSAGGQPGRTAGGVWWAVPGLAVGFAAGVGGTLLIRRAAARPGVGPPREEPRQELIDLDL